MALRPGAVKTAHGRPAGTLRTKRRRRPGGTTVDARRHDGGRGSDHASIAVPLFAATHHRLPPIERLVPMRLAPDLTAAPSTAGTAAGPQPGPVAVRPMRRALRELMLVAALFLAYKLGRLAVDGQVDQAFRNAQTVWDLEGLLRLPSEVAVQQFLLAETALVQLTNAYYAYVHFPATTACLIWIYLRRPDHYRWTRRMIAWLTAAAFTVHVLVPLAPPRMLPALGIVDTGMLYGPSVYGPPATDSLSNQYAAMPSLHVGWAVAVAVALIVSARGRWRWLALAHPLVTLGVVIATGNHYWLDAAMAVALLSVVLAVLPRPVVALHVAVPRQRLAAPQRHEVDVHRPEPVPAGSVR
jgi:hypothetical protein